METLPRRLAREHRTVDAMVRIYCRAHHGGRPPGEREPCTECRELLEFAEFRLRKCPHGERKPACANCPIHCYVPARREQIRAVMRFAGPRMLLRHPIFAVRHWLDGRRPVPSLPARRGGRGSVASG